MQAIGSTITTNSHTGSTTFTCFCFCCVVGIASFVAGIVSFVAGCVVGCVVGNARTIDVAGSDFGFGFFYTLVAIDASHRLHHRLHLCND
jgi:hypothetical protein